jgi:feruloyl esterase
VIYDAAIAACDALDGVADGLISNQAKCNAMFDPTVVRCTGGADTGDTCLSDAQIQRAEDHERRRDVQLLSVEWVSVIPGYNVWGADLGMTRRPRDMRCRPS